MWTIPANTDIFVWVLRLQPNKLTIDHQTKVVLEEDNILDGI